MLCCLKLLLFSTHQLHIIYNYHVRLLFFIYFNSFIADYRNKLVFEI